MRSQQRNPSVEGRLSMQYTDNWTSTLCQLDLDIDWQTWYTQVDVSCFDMIFDNFDGLVI